MLTLEYTDDGAAHAAEDGENDRHENEGGSDLDEHTVNEGLNLTRIGENRAHLDTDYSLVDYEDEPDFDPDGAWTPVNPEITNITFKAGSVEAH